MREKILQIDDADQPVERSFTDGIASVRLPTNEVADLIHRHIHIEPCDVAAVGHDRLHAAVTQREDTADDLLLDSLHSSVLGAFLHDRLDLGLRYGTVGIAQPEQTGNALDALRKEPYERGGDDRQHLHRAGHEFGDRLGGRHTDTLGNQLSEHDSQIGHHDHDERLRYGSRIGNSPADEDFPQVVGDGRPRINTGQNTDQSNTDLDGRKKFVGIFRQLEGLASPLLPCLACAVRFDLRAEIRAISDMANRPLSRISRRIMNISML